MAKTFKDLQGTVVTIIDGATAVSTDSDIETDEISRYVVEVYDTSYEVSESTYDAVKNYIKK